MSFSFYKELLKLDYIVVYLLSNYPIASMHHLNNKKYEKVYK